MRKSVLFPLVIALLMMSSCTSFLDFQSGRTLGEGNNELTVSATSINLKNDENQAKPYVAPSVEFKRGLTEKLDIGLQSQPFSFIGVNSKYQFVGDQKSKLAVAGMLKLGYDYTVSDEITFSALAGYGDFYDPKGTLDTLALNYSAFRTELGAVGSYHLGKELAITSTLKGLVFAIENGSTYTFVNTFGIEVGKKTKVVFNFGYNLSWEETSFDSGFAFGRWQYGIGVRKPINFATKKEEPKTLQ